MGKRKKNLCMVFYLFTVLICPGCYNRTPQTEWLINNRNLFLIVLEAGKSKIKTSADSVFSKPGSWLIDGALFAVSPCCGRVLELFGVSFI